GAVIPRRVVWVPIFGLAALIVAGLVVLVRRGAWLIVFIVLGSVGLICTTPWPSQFGRYLMPMTPFLTMAATLTLERSEAALRAWGSVRTIALGRAALAGLLVLTFAAQIYATLSLFRLRGAPFVPGGGSR